MVENINSKLSGFFVASLLIYLSVMYFPDTRVGAVLRALAIVSVMAPFFYQKIVFARREREMSEKFVEFIRALVSSVKSGMPIPQAIVFVARDDFGVLTPYVKALANKITWGISLTKALEYFAESTKIPSIMKNVHIILQAEKSGGYIEDVLDNVTQTLKLDNRLKARRRVTIQSQIGQSYVIYIIFIVVLIVIQNYLVPYMVDYSDEGNDEVTTESNSLFAGGEGGTDASIVKLFSPVEIQYTSISDFIFSIIDWIKSIEGVFMSLSLMQGFFSGMVLGQLAEGKPGAGLQHSFIMMSIGLVVLSFI